jgi:hypothetical protein
VTDGHVQAVLLARLAVWAAVGFLHEKLGTPDADGGGGRVEAEVVGILFADGAGDGPQGAFEQAVEAALAVFSVGVLVDAEL